MIRLLIEIRRVDIHREALAAVRVVTTKHLLKAGSCRVAQQAAWHIQKQLFQVRLFLCVCFNNIILGW